MKFSLIVCSLGRKDDLYRLFDSLVEQSFKDFEVIFVDQNDAGYLSDLIDSYSKLFKIKHIFSAPGLSKARNIGLKYAMGEYIAFPDDDCWYSQDTLTKVFNTFNSASEVDVVTSGYQDASGAIGLKAPPCRYKINLLNVWKSAISFTIFLRRRDVVNDLYFNEELGVGSKTKWGAGEETEFLVRLINNNLGVFMYPDLGIYHPVKDFSFNGYDRKRVSSYARGNGRVLRITKYPIWIVSLSFGKTLLRIITNFMRGNRKASGFYYLILKSKIIGYMDK
ncbi:MULTISPECIES: glycosyltransferase family 2 protein [Klebsiella pneumoniae complex]|uniref:glycosyltransferase family 2 protein n=1 Tax=Klebsiella pneumoniae complex TaxID=3390273 RepID=UPI000B407197|nr:glycosyltransferase family 2 protein [Klebsiella quasipneumoniae]MDV5429772.1 glycosyltransferase family 2 protein [Klebsiella quasipneumoniae]OVX13731.1 hypothetical protein BME39_18475 [Klebsiella quasipneumoniae subsp. similipneumoniae]